MLFVSAVLSTLVLQAAAWPSVMNELARSMQSKRGLVVGDSAEIAASKARTNCGPTACTVFDASEQFVSTTGDYAWASPAASDIRGPCPGLNAAANHGYLPRSGVPTIADTIDGLGAAYGMSPELAAALAVIAIVLDGDPLTGTWSIGGPPADDDLLDDLVSTGSGISYSHNNYENDASIGRADAYLNDGNAHSLIVSRFASAYAASDSNGLYNLDLFAQNYKNKTAESIAENPYAFWGAFSGLVSPAAYNFVINFMSNHTEEEPSGYFNGDMFKTFFAVTGDYPDFTWLPGQERIPDNWYRRPTIDGYTAVDLVGDLVINFLAYDTFLLGGNTGTTDSFVGVQLGNLTGGLYSVDTLFEDNNLSCFLFQAAQEAIPSSDDAVTDLLDAVDDLIDTYISPIISSLGCSELDEYNTAVFSEYPGYSYHPTGTAQNYRRNRRNRISA